MVASREDPPVGQGVVPGFEPEDERERGLAADLTLRRGLSWGRPRRGHPEGTVGAHVAELLRTIDEWGEQGIRRTELRFLALVHDALKWRVDERLPKRGENHHATRARRFAERYTSDERLLATVELHDRPYAIWRRMRRTGKDQDEALEAMLDRLPDLPLFLRFVEVDSSTAGKDPAPLEWLRGELARRAGEG